MASDVIGALDRLGIVSAEIIWLPVLAWTISAALALIVLRSGTTIHPGVRYRLAQAALLSLPVGVAMSLVLRFEPLAPVAHALPSLPLLTVGSAEPDWLVAVVATESTPALISWWTVAGLATVGAICAALVALIVLVRDAIGLARFKRGLHAGGEGYEVKFFSRRTCTVMASKAVSVPITFGWLRPEIVLPDDLSPEERQLAIDHEMVHIRRADYAAAWAERLVAVLFAVHPLVHVLRRECGLLRELSCDAALMEQGLTDKPSYARLLYTLADRSPVTPAASIAMVQSPSFIRKRIEAMSSRFSINMNVTTRWVLAGLVLVVIAGLMSLPRTVSATTATGTEGALAADTIVVALDEMPTPVGGMEAIQASLVYPGDARAEGVQGTVILEFLVSVDGNVTEVEVASGVDKRLDAAAMDALANTRFEPGTRDGEAVPVRMAIPIRFRLGDDDRAGDGLRIVMRDYSVTDGVPPNTKQLRIDGTVLRNGAPLRNAQVFWYTDTHPAGRVGPSVTGGDGAFSIVTTSQEFTFPVHLVAEHARGTAEVVLDHPDHLKIGRDTDWPPPPQTPPQPRDGDPYVVVEQMPTPIGGMEGLQARVVYPELARRTGIEGTVFVQFVVDEDGSPSDVTIARGIGGGADEAAAEAVRQTRFTPGLHEGEPVRVRFSLPVRFSLEEEATGDASRGDAYGRDFYAITIVDALVRDGKLVIRGYVRHTDVVNGRPEAIAARAAKKRVVLAGGPWPQNGADAPRITEALTTERGEFEFEAAFSERWEMLFVMIEDDQGMANGVMLPQARLVREG